MSKKCEELWEEMRKADFRKEGVLNEKNLQLNQYLKSKYSKEYIKQIWINNIDNNLSILKRIKSEGINLFRISSNILPLFDFNLELRGDDDILLRLNDIGKFVLSNKMRVTSHPDQFVVLSSNNNEVIKNSIKILEYHAWVFDKIGLPENNYYCINIHGGTKGNSEILINSIEMLSSNIRNRLTLENDERSYNVLELKKIYDKVNIPICLDSHHHEFNSGGISFEEALEISKKTWGDIKPITHLSNTDPQFINGSFFERRKHSEYVHYIPIIQAEENNKGLIDIELEFKMKNIALYKAVEDFNLKL